MDAGFKKSTSYMGQTWRQETYSLRVFIQHEIQIIENYHLYAGVWKFASENQYCLFQGQHTSLTLYSFSELSLFHRMIAGYPLEKTNGFEKIITGALKALNIRIVRR